LLRPDERRDAVVGSDHADSGKDMQGGLSRWQGGEVAVPVGEEDRVEERGSVGRRGRGGRPEERRDAVVGAEHLSMQASKRRCKEAGRGAGGEERSWY
jgi:hypothetical protein